MGLSSAVDWWEKWQLRILVLGSLSIQWLLFLSANLRKIAIPSWFRSIIWLAYQGSDALAIYALANLFSRQSRLDCSSGQGNSILEVVWAPVLLMHLGGLDLITAYNIEDNELWSRHLLTAVSQITVAIYVFCKTWPGGDKRLLQASILLFVPGILKCIQKPLALKAASFNSLVNPSDPGPRRATNREGGISSLDDYVQAARDFVLAKCHPQDRGEGDTIDLEQNHVPEAQGEANKVDLEGNHHRQDNGKWNAADLEPNHVPQAQGDVDAMDLDPSHLCQSYEKACADNFKANQASKISRWWRFLLTAYSSEVRAASSFEQKKIRKEKKIHEGKQRRLDLASRKLFVDLALSYPDRLSILEKFLVQVVDKSAYVSLQEELFRTFDLIYTKIRMTTKAEMSTLQIIGFYTRLTATYLPFAAIGLFHKSDREVYNVNDVKVTYALLCCTAVLEMFDFSILDESETEEIGSAGIWSRMVPQYSLIGFFIRDKRHSKKMSIVSFFNCKDFLDQRWCMKSCSSSSRITELVLRHVIGWWKHIVDTASYRRFSDHRGQWTIKHTRCDQDLEWGLNRPFDESVLLWHIATDLCIYQNGGPSATNVNALTCREISNYMIYLLFVNPEMLLSSTRRNLFMEANAELEEILKGDKPLLKKILKGDKPSLMETLMGNKPVLEFLKGKGPSPEETERGFMQKIITKLQPTKRREDDPGYTELAVEEEQRPYAEGFIQDASKISKALLALDDEKMWKVIEGVWVEMLCFSAGRCRGYLHAKSMGSGVELLTYIWFLLSHMGMETLPERLQRTELSRGEGNTGATPSTSQVSTATRETIFS